jgi:flagellar protein FlbD
MIELHRLGHALEPFHVNPDLIVTVEAAPDTHVTLSTGTKFIVTESPTQIADAIRTWRASILAEALGARESGVLA